MAESLCFPKGFFKKTFAVSMDYGNSAIKLVHTTEEGDNLRMKFANFKKESFEEAMEYIRDKCRGQLDEGGQMNICGFGASKYKDTIEKALNISLTTIPEGDTGITAFKFLAKHVPWDDLFHEPSRTATEYGSVCAKQFADVYKGISHGKIKPFAYMEDVEANDAAVRSFDMTKTVQYPVLLVGIGSGLLAGLMQEDGTFLTCSNINGPAGRTFLGLGSLLTDAKDFHELAELAEKGNASNVDQWLGGIGGNKDDDLYNKFIGADLKVYAFGHAAGRCKDEFRREDLAAATLSLVAASAANEAYFWASHHKVKQVYFIAGLAASTAHVREEISKEFAIRRFANSLGHICDCRFMKQGAHLGAIGVLLSNLEVAEQM